MRKFLTTLCLFLILFNLYAQKQRTVNVYLQAQQNWTIHDITKGNNPNGFGLGAQAFLNTKSRFKATLELTADAYMMNDKVLRLRKDESIIPDVRGMINLFAGASWHPIKIFYMSVAIGPSFIGGEFGRNTCAGFKSAIGFFSKNQRWTGKINYINILNRDSPTKLDFISAGVAIGYRIH